MYIGYGRSINDVYMSTNFDTLSFNISIFNKT
jgi:hypothetical protein